MATESTGQLEAVSGPLQGKAFTLAEGEISIGRDPSNGVSLLDALVSRRHCVLRNTGGKFAIQDLESRNSTFVNGVPVREAELADADQIRVGNSVFVFHAPQSDNAVLASLRLDAATPPGGSTIVLRKQDALYLDTRQRAASLPASPRTVSDLNALLKFARTVNSVRHLAALQQQILDALLEAAPADRAAVLLLDEGTREFASVVGRDRRSGPSQHIRASRTILNRVLEEGVAVLANDVTADEEFQRAESLAGPRVSSVLAAPLAVRDNLLGVVYLDAVTPGVRFDSDLLQLVTGLANTAALAIDNVRHLAWLEGENSRLRQELNVDHNMIGDSPAIREVHRFIARVAPAGSTVLITGESGTGKELVARAIHAHSERASKPFVAINCAAIADTLLESELFGHEKGAFTGASAQKKGKLEMAGGGTVFLDEVGELAPQLQAKLLRVLQEREFERVGGTRAVKLDIRVIAATNRDLKEAVKNGTFRQDLFYRLNVVSIRMPALRERREDIPLLANYFAARCSAKVKRRVLGLSPKARACLLRYDWPGNVRELENAIERAVVLGTTELILPEELPGSVLEDAAVEGEPPTALHEGIREAKKTLIEHAIEKAGGNYTEAAGILGVHPNHLFRLIRTLDMTPKRRRQAT